MASIAIPHGLAAVILGALSERGGELWSVDIAEHAGIDLRAMDTFDADNALDEIEEACGVLLADGYVERTGMIVDAWRLPRKGTTDDRA